MYLCSMEFQQDVEAALATLHNGGLILYPTDTIWGIGCDATNPVAVEKIYQLKQRANEKAMIVLVADARDLLQYVANVDLAIFDYLESVQKPTTVIYEGAIGLADNLLAEDGSAGIRVVEEPFLKHLIKRFRKPIVSTSANISGEPSPANFNEVGQQIRSGVDYIVEYRQADLTPATPSSVVKWSQEGIIVLRP